MKTMDLFKNRNDSLSGNEPFKLKTNRNIYSEHEFRNIIERERARADRADNEFSLVVIELDFVDDNHHATTRILKDISARTRKIDEIGWYGPNRIGIILPYTSVQGAQVFAESICSLVRRSLPECRARIYTYALDKISA